MGCFGRKKEGRNGSSGCDRSIMGELYCDQSMNHLSAIKLAFFHHWPGLKCCCDDQYDRNDFTIKAC